MGDDRARTERIFMLPPERIDWLTKPIGRFLRIEAAAGGILLFFAFAALVLSNSPWAKFYSEVWETSFGIHAGSIELNRSLREWINDGFMTLYFFLVSLELKREVILGELRSPRMAAFPIAAALGGMLVPALIYILLQSGESGQHG